MERGTSPLVSRWRECLFCDKCRHALKIIVKVCFFLQNYCIHPYANLVRDDSYNKDFFKWATAPVRNNSCR